MNIDPNKLYIIPDLSNVIVHVKGDQSSIATFFQMIAKRVDQDPIVGSFSILNAIDSIIETNTEYDLSNFYCIPDVYSDECMINKFNGDTIMFLADFKNFYIKKRGNHYTDGKKVLQKLFGVYAMLFPNLEIYIGYNRNKVYDIRENKYVKMSEVVSKYIYNEKRNPKNCRRNSETVAIYSEDQFRYHMRMIKVTPAFIDDNGMLDNKYQTKTKIMHFIM